MVRSFILLAEGDSLLPAKIVRYADSAETESRDFDRPFQSVVDGVSPKRVRYATANRPCSEKPNCPAIAAILAVVGSVRRSA